MKKLFAALAVLLMAGAQVKAEQVSVEMAQQVATNFFIRQCGADKNIGLVECSASRGLRQTYLFVPENGKGFVLVAKDNVARPILGYSLVNEFPVDIAPATRAWLNWYADEIDMQAAVGQPLTEAVTNEWNELLQADTDGPVFSVVVAPLTTTQWNQSPYYNALCPYNTTDSFRCVTGCVATATAQIMKYWNHPAQGKGSHSYNSGTYGTLSANFGATTYDWANMPNRLNSGSSSAQINAVATLMAHIGVAVHMSYGRSSGAVTASSSSIGEVTAERSLYTYFGYSKSIHSVRKDYVSDSVWQALLDNELANSRPILYSGRDSSGGHAFVCDGRNNAGYYHYNWGWGGYCDDYYPIDALNPAPGGIGGNATYRFNLKQTAIIGIRPEPNTSGTFTLTARPDDSRHGSVSGSGTKNYGDTVTMTATAAAGYRFLHWSDGMNYNPRTVIVGGNDTYTANYAPLAGDTLQYDNGIYYTSWSNKYWGIKFDPADLRGHTYFTGVMAYLKTGSHEVKIYSGTSISSSTLIQSVTYNNTVGTGWQTISMPLPMVVDTTKPLWITLHNTSQSYPSTASVYSGNSNSAFVSSNGTTWTNPQRTFLVRGIFSTPQNYYTVTANASPSVGGTVTGGGRCLEGHALTLTATPAACYHFERWSDGVQLASRTVSVFGNNTYTALFVKDTVRSVYPATVCDTYTWIDGNTYTASNNTATHALQTVGGCDSIVTLNLTLNRSTNSTETRAECERYVWFDSTLTLSGTYRKTLLGGNVSGCDSVIELNLTVNHSTYDSIDTFACAYLRWFDSTYSESGIYSRLFAQGNAVGCDSTVYLTLEVGSVYEFTDTVVASSPYTWRNDSVYTEAGSYQMRALTQQGCDSVYNLVLSFNNKIGDVSEDELVVYPNPTVDRLNVIGDGIESVQLFDVAGKCIATVNGGGLVEMGNLAEGVYVLRVRFEGDRVAIRKIVKQ